MAVCNDLLDTRPVRAEIDRREAAGQVIAGRGGEGGAFPMRSVEERRKRSAPGPVRSSLDLHNMFKAEKGTARQSRSMSGKHSSPTGMPGPHCRARGRLLPRERRLQKIATQIYVCCVPRAAPCCAATAAPPPSTCGALERPGGICQKGSGCARSVRSAAEVSVRSAGMRCQRGGLEGPPPADTDVLPQARVQGCGSPWQD